MTLFKVLSCLFYFNLGINLTCASLGCLRLKLPFLNSLSHQFPSCPANCSSFCFSHLRPGLSHLLFYEASTVSPFLEHFSVMSIPFHFFFTIFFLLVSLNFISLLTSSFFTLTSLLFFKRFLRGSNSRVPILGPCSSPDFQVRRCLLSLINKVYYLLLVDKDWIHITVKITEKCRGAYPNSFATIALKRRNKMYAMYDNCRQS